MADWGKISSRGNVEDRRHMAPIAGGISLGGVVLLLAMNYLAGGDMSTALQSITEYAAQQPQQQIVKQPINDGYQQFAAAVMGSNNDLWSKLFQERNQQYTPSRLVLFRTSTASECGGADARYGPHYCPVDQTIYLDETFFDMLVEKLGGSKGDVAQAYVISHEVGHHIQNLLGTLEQVHNSSSQQQAIALELQADCYAGIWANSLKDRNIFEPGEIKEAMEAAKAVGDDRVQEAVQGYVNKESWTHGSSEERLRWFTTGYNTGNIAACNTFQ